MGKFMTVIAWNNGNHHKSGAGYGLKIDFDDRQKYFDKEWDSIELKLEGRDGSLTANIDKKSFWTKKCGELIHQDIGAWFIQNGLAPWPRNKPPKLILEPMQKNSFFSVVKSKRTRILYERFTIYFSKGEKF